MPLTMCPRCRSQQAVFEAKTKTTRCGKCHFSFTPPPTTPLTPLSVVDPKQRGQRGI